MIHWHTRHLSWRKTIFVIAYVHNYTPHESYERMDLFLKYSIVVILYSFKSWKWTTSKSCGSLSCGWIYRRSWRNGIWLAGTNKKKDPDDDIPSGVRRERERSITINQRSFNHNNKIKKGKKKKKMMKSSLREKKKKSCLGRWWRKQ